MNIALYEKVMTPLRKNVLAWRISMYHVIGLKQTHGVKNVTPKAAKKNRGCHGLLGRVITKIFFSSYNFSNYSDCN